jgi:hypothetical protein
MRQKERSYRLYFRSPLLIRNRARCNLRRCIAFRRAVLLGFLVARFTCNSFLAARLPLLYTAVTLA